MPRSCRRIPTIRLPISRYRINFATAEVKKHAREADIIFTATYHACLPAYRAATSIGKPVACLVLGLQLTPSEMEALLRLPRPALVDFAGRLDDRICRFYPHRSDPSPRNGS